MDDASPVSIFRFCTLRSCILFDSYSNIKRKLYEITAVLILTLTYSAAHLVRRKLYDVKLSGDYPNPIRHAIPTGEVNNVLNEVRKISGMKTDKNKLVLDTQWFTHVMLRVE